MPMEEHIFSFVFNGIRQPNCGRINVIYTHEFHVMHAHLSSSQAKGTKSTSFLTHVRNEVDLVPLACEDGTFVRLKHL